MSTKNDPRRRWPGVLTVRALRLGALLAVAAGLLAVAARTAIVAQAPSGWRAGQPFVEELAQPSAEATQQRGRALALGRALRLDGAPSASVRRRDIRDAQVFDEIEFTSADGRRTAEVRLDPASGRARMIVRFDRPSTGGAVTTSASAPGLALGFARAAAIDLPITAPAARWDGGLGTWEVTWDRIVRGAPVPGDGVTLGVFPNGEFSGLSVFESPLARAPAQPIDADRARGVALGWAADHGITAMKDLSVQAPVLQWRHPNNFADPTRSDAPDSVARLVYVVGFRYLPVGAAEPTQVDLYVDAGDGSIQGGAAAA